MFAPSGKAQRFIPDEPYLAGVNVSEAMPAARPRFASTLSGCSAIWLFEPPMSALAPSPAPTAAPTVAPA
jgi:hypothetical protein